MVPRPSFDSDLVISSSSQLRRIGCMTYLGMFSEHVSVPVTPHASILECRFDCYHIWRIADSSPSTPRLITMFLLSCWFQRATNFGDRCHQVAMVRETTYMPMVDCCVYSVAHSKPLQDREILQVVSLSSDSMSSSSSASESSSPGISTHNHYIHCHQF